MQEDFRQMNSAVSDLDALNGMARSLERSVARREGKNLTGARKAIARSIGLSVDAFENFLYRRTKTVPNWLMNRVRAELISVLQLEVQYLEHEIQLHRQIGTDHSSDTLASAETQLAKARELLTEKVK